MAYQTLYRKYRPRSFKDVVGQKNIVRVLSNAIIHNKIAHAYLFCGPRGTGKTSMAKIFAKLVNCENLQGVEPCNECKNCKQIENKNFLDIIEIDAASNNGVDEIREIKNKANLAPNSGKYKVYIIDEVHMLSIGAFNALLKTLEEPPAHIIFILATTEPHKLPITVISRCQRFDFKKFLDCEIEENLRKICTLEGFSVSNEVLKEIAILSDGGMRDAIGLLDQLSVYENNNLNIDDLYQLSGTLSKSSEIDLIDMYFKNNISQFLDKLYLFEQNGKNFVKIADDLLTILEQILKYKVIDSYENADDVNLKEKYLSISRNVDKNRLYSLITRFSSEIRNIKSSSNPRILLEIVFLMEYNDENLLQTNVPVKGTPILQTSVESIENKKLIPNVDKKSTENIEISVSKYKNFLLSLDNVMELKNVRINNSLATANKDCLLRYKDKLPMLLEFMFDSNYDSIVCNMQDCELRVAGKMYVILSTKYSSSAEILNGKIYLVDELFSKIFSSAIKTIFITDDEWKTIKTNYVRQKSENIMYNFIPEKNYFTECDSKKNENSDLEGIFGNEIDDIIEVR